MDKKFLIENSLTTIIFRTRIRIGSILERRFPIKYIGDEVNGLNRL